MCRRVCNKTIILLGLAGYELDVTNSTLRASLVTYHFIPARPRRIIVKYIYIYIYIHTRFQKRFNPEIYIYIYFWIMYIDAYFCLAERAQVCMTNFLLLNVRKVSS